MESIALIIALIAFMLYANEREKENKEERKDLMDRLMAKDFQEYAVHTQPTPKYDPVGYSETDEYLMELEDRKM